MEGLDRWSGRQAGRQAGRQVRTQVTESIWSSKAACRSHCTLCVDPAEAPCSSCIFLSMASPRSLARIRCKQALHALCLVAFVFFPNAQMQRPFTLGTCREAGQRPGHKLRHGHMLQPTLGTRREAGLRPGHKLQPGHMLQPTLGTCREAGQRPGHKLRPGHMLQPTLAHAGRPA